MWTAQFFKFLEPRRIITSGGLGTMGYGFPASIGAQAAYPDMLVIDIAGDGSIQMNIQELATAVQYGLPVKVVILNNGCLGMVRQWQELFYEKRYALSKLECMPNFVKLAEAYGAVGYEIEHESEVDKVLKKAFANGSAHAHRRPRESGGGRLSLRSGRRGLARHAACIGGVLRHIISVLVENEFGVLARVAGLFSGRGFNIESLCVGETLDPEISTMTIVTSGSESILEQILKQLNKLVNVIKVTDFQDADYVSREMVLVKINAEEKTREEVLRMAEIFRGRVVDVSPRSYVVEITGNEEKVQAFLNLVRPLGIKELVRTGSVAMMRGEKAARGE